MKSPSLTILEGDCIEQLKTLPDESVHCCVTSPPYWGLRDYGTAKWEGGDGECDHIDPNGPINAPSDKSTLTTNAGKGPLPGDKYQTDRKAQFRSTCAKCGARRVDGQIGLEKTPEEYVAKMVAVFREVKRVLRGDGTCWVNLGDSYASSPPGCSGVSKASTLHGQMSEVYRETLRNGCGQKRNTIVGGLKPKDLCGIPWRVAFALQADGWWLRQDIIWSKPNCMPESVTDRCTKAHEYIFLLSKSASYFYDAEAIKEPSETEPHAPGWSTQRPTDSGPMERRKADGSSASQWDEPNRVWGNGTRNKRSVWTIPSQPYSEAHFATFPEALVNPCIIAGTSARGCCPECGAPWEREINRVISVSKDCPKTMKSHMARGGSGEPVGTVGKSGSKRINGYTETLGWNPTCDCGCTNTVPCTVLDPFGGSFTTCQVALELSRNAVGIELNPEYVKLARARCAVTPGLALA